MIDMVYCYLLYRQSLTLVQAKTLSAALYLKPFIVLLEPIKIR